MWVGCDLHLGVVPCLSAGIMSDGFEGLPKDFFKFFRDLEKNNERDWFQTNKERYKSSVQAPLLAFIKAMEGPLADVSDCFIADPRGNGGSMFRIYRDVRFSRDKRPYKEHAACQFRHMSGKDAHAPGFYVHLAPAEVMFGGGIWRPPNPVLTKIREAIVDDPEGWKKITRSRTFKKRFTGVRGDSLKRAPQGFDPEHPLLEDLKRKSFFAMQQVDPKLTLTPKFLKEVRGAFSAMAPFMEFLTTAVGHSFSLDD